MTFVSKAKLETINASSVELEGILDKSKSAFAFKINMSTIHGFNSPLQREHFFENYVDANNHPQAIFKGKILNISNWETKTKSILRAKGSLFINGVGVERILEVTLIPKGQGFSFESSFLIPLKDHKISIPRIVDQKIAKEVSVFVKGELK
jgi:polyisoprenoid-binding protein YceI